ncbi:MAG: CRISPR-associated endonuclease Cas1 [Candidatus Acididesulfobacter guangdongensis]|uniref:CRISPR-associated endonuclease Cas1 n=1 Tax=Acididesulfobacter guangdongensis TaxID=2597225 RepID=A0A519BFX2_ACIG2|nr:MAG: CRISPR-associated endonuclease Cas1 [Candidatus Acididesulfobacter guangdongensis]
MSTLYISEQGAVVTKISRRLSVQKNSKTILEIPIIKIDKVFLFGNIQITTQAINFLLESNIDVSFFTMNGKCHGRLTAMESKNIFLRLIQYERFLDKEYQIKLARTIVKSKLNNEIDLIYSFSKNYGISRFKDILTGIKNCILQLDNKITINSIMGVEGIAAAYFFKAFKMMIRNENFIFTVREKNPSLDPINSLLSFGYTLITNEILNMLFGNGFDPYIGFLHGINYGRPSLALDLVEEFRSSIDGFTLKLINKSIIAQDDFVSSTGGVFLKNHAMKKYFNHYDKLMAESTPKSKRLYIKDRINMLKKSITNRTDFIPINQVAMPYP